MTWPTTHYRGVSVDGHSLAGESASRPDGPWHRFLATLPLLWIDEAHSEPGFPERCWELQDGYGEPGFVPAQGWDWSGIRDSSEGAVLAMWALAAEALPAERLAERLGVDAALLRGPRAGAAAPR